MFDVNLAALGSSFLPYSPECVELDFSHLGARRIASAKASMSDPLAFCGSVYASDPQKVLPSKSAIAFSPYEQVQRTQRRIGGFLAIGPGAS